MKKQVLSRGFLGFPLGITIGYVITIAISLSAGQGSYIPCVPEFVATVGSEINAVLLQTALCGVLGASFGACSMIWEMDSWSIAKQSLLYFLITSVFMMPIAYITSWMEHSWGGFLLYFGIFTSVFLAVWIIQYIILRSKISQINEQIVGK